MRPSVTVPVLSSTIVVIRRVCSSTSGPLIRIPSCAPRPVPTISAVGVASPSAHGQAMISTATAAVNAADASPGERASRRASRARSRCTIGTKTAETRSASRCTGALPGLRLARPAARSARARCRRRPSSRATTSRPEVLIVAPATSSPGPTSTGTGSPVSIDWSTAESPSTTTPSVAIFSPGRTTNGRRPRARSTGTSTSSPSRSTRASFAPSSSSARIAAPERRFARASKKRPSRISVVITAATSKYMSRVEPAERARPSTTSRRRACRARRACPSSLRRAERSAARRGGTAQPHQKTTGVASASATHSQPSNCSGGIIAISDERARTARRDGEPVGRLARRRARRRVFARSARGSRPLDRADQLVGRDSADGS